MISLATMATTARRRVTPTLFLLLGAFAAPPAVAQHPTPEQTAAIRQSCRSDYIEHCSSVPTGGAAALNCLRQNEAEVAPACRQALAAIGGDAAAAPHAAPGGGGGATAAQGGNPMELFRDECGMDVRRLCRGVFPGGGRMIGCLAENREQLSPGCRAAMLEMRERR